MAPNSCGGCLASAGSINEVLKILNNEWGACENCPNERVLRTLCEQYRRHHPQWWVVDGALVVPIWIVEKIRTPGITEAARIALISAG